MNAKKKIYLICRTFAILFILFGCSSKNKENEAKKTEVVAQAVVREDDKKEGRRFVDNGNGTITDNYSGLMWEKEASGNMNWDEAVEYCKDVANAGGKKGWRLPTLLEFQNILDDTNSRCMLPGVLARKGYQCTYHWTSEIFPSGIVRIIDPSNAKLNQIHKDGRNGRGMTRCVRVDDPAKVAKSQFSYTGPRFRDLGNGLIKDTKTGLIWTRRLPIWKSWDKAVLHCQNLKKVALTWQTLIKVPENLKWRLPTKEELQGIIVNNHPIYPLDDLFKISGGGGTANAWTSTEISPSFAWGMSYGQIQKLLKRQEYGVICVSSQATDNNNEENFSNSSLEGEIYEVFGTRQTSVDPWLAVRLGPGTNTALIAQLLEHTRVKLTGKIYRNWVEIEVLDGPNKGIRGWASRRYLRPFKNQ